MRSPPFLVILLDVGQTHLGERVDGLVRDGVCKGDQHCPL